MLLVIAAAAVLLDLLLGEPRRAHPLVLFGTWAQRIEARLHREQHHHCPCSCANSPLVRTRCCVTWGLRGTGRRARPMARRVVTEQRLCTARSTAALPLSRRPTNRRRSAVACRYAGAGAVIWQGRITHVMRRRQKHHLRRRMHQKVLVRNIPRIRAGQRKGQAIARCQYGDMLVACQHILGRA